MSLGDVFAFFGVLLSLGLALPGLLLAWALICPGVVTRAQVRLAQTPGRCFWLGGLWVAISIPPLVLLFNLPSGVSQLIGWLGVVGLLTFASLGAAGLAALMGMRLRAAGLAASSPGALVRGAVALELAVVFPVIGWFVLLPLIIVSTLGAAGFALLHWMPRPAPAPLNTEAVHGTYPS
jgi:hypothetical protein